jgi:LysM repeat protein
MKHVIKILSILLLSVLLNGTLSAQSGVEISNVIQRLDGSSFYLHTVEKGHTLYSISRAYKIDTEVLELINPEIADGLTLGQDIKIPNIKGRNSSNAEIEVADQFNFYEVEKGNTLYSLSKQFNMSVDEIHNWNPWLQNGFNPGLVLRFPKQDSDADALKAQLWQQNQSMLDSTVFVDHTVEAGQTLYSIGKHHNVGVDVLIEYNPSVKDGLSVGEILKVPVMPESINNSMDSTIVTGTDTIRIQEATNFLEHVVQHGETLYSLSKKYDIAKEEILKYNPFASEILSVGAIVRIPETGKEIKPVEELISDAEERGLAIKDTFVWEDRRYYYHEVMMKETLYSISKFYHIKIRKVVKANTDLDNDQLAQGDVIRIPKKDIKDIKTVARRVKQKYARLAETAPIREIVEMVNQSVFPCDTFICSNQDTFNVALMLPFYLFSNDTLGMGDTLIVDGDKADTRYQITAGADNEEQIVIYDKSKVFLEFYEGFLLAVDTMKQQGLNINLHVFDTDKSADSVKAILEDSIMLTMDLIVGPVYNSTLSVVNEFSKEHNIKLVSPLMASSDEFVANNPNFIQVTPSQETKIKAFSTVLSNYFHKNIVVLHYGSLKEQDVVELYKKYLVPQLKLNAGTDDVMFSDYLFDREKSFQIVKPRKDEENNDVEIIDHPLKKALIDSIPNLVILPSRERGLVSNTIRQLNTIYKEVASDYDITLCGFSNAMKYENIDMEYFHNLEFHTFTIFLPDYSKKEVKNFIKKYRASYFSEPDQFGFQGYDVGFYFLNLMKNYGPEFQDCIYKQINDTSITLTQNEFHFIQKSSETGYENHQVFVLMYDHDYDIIRLDKLFNAAPAVVKEENAPVLLPKEEDSDSEARPKEVPQTDNNLKLYRKPQ